MAIKAHIDPAQTGAGQRGTPRQALRLETSGLGPDGGAANVVIHNISAAGLLIETALELREGDRLALDLPEAGLVTAMIVWRSERLYGCAFEQALGPAALAAAQLQSSARERPATPGISSSQTGEVLGVRINRLRREAGLTLADIAARLGVSKPTVWAWEKGKARPLPERIDAIAAALGVATEEIVAAPAPDEGMSAVIEECRLRIAQACATPPARVRIMVEL
ncbi:helix-turn-helix domain-containing protein [Porphyrobacter sp. LM 6]|uniref:helix-turn-helix domain-containing protein n=1 Tax=Porphyrobacter sp. LM 6 TaxID=1896196 RepID=UPI0008472DEA|nr:helix-turn-helix domain-containing protein [Porphyrobacter sp. LM 6]AOL93054.1 DNA-binding transcriptional regulator, XRE-family HTH domain [Porphyrobacter sp. LM 6]